MLKFRYDINALRAISVLAVFIYHLFPNFLTGGFLGVDCFFVISGFLISSIIIGDVKLGDFSLVKFYSKRIKRTFPMLLFTILLVALVANIFYPITPILQTYKTISYSAVQLANIIFAKSKYDYWTSDITNQNPLLHTWSLGIEEQFYLIYPIFILLLSKFKPTQKTSSMFFVITFLILASFILSAILVKNNPIAAFYLPFTRFWELLIGAILSFYPKFLYQTSKQSKARTLLNNALCLLGFAIIILSFTLTKQASYNPWLSLIACLGVVLVILFGGQTSGLVSKIFQNKLLYHIGLTSYSIYLLHYPAIEFFKYYNSTDAVPLTQGLTIIVIVILTSLLTYKFVEQKFRYSKIKFYYFLLFALFLSLSFTAIRKTLKVKSMPWGIKNQNIITQNNCIFRLNDANAIQSKFLQRNILKDCSNQKDIEPSILLFGNSHIYNVIDGVLQFAKLHKTSFVGIEALRMQDEGHEENKLEIFNKLNTLYSNKHLKYLIFSFRKAVDIPFLKEHIEIALKKGKVVIFVIQIPAFLHNVTDCASFTKFALLPKRFQNVKCGFEPNPLTESTSKQIDAIISLSKKYKNCISLTHINIC